MMLSILFPLQFLDLRRQLGNRFSQRLQSVLIVWIVFVVNTRVHDVDDRTGTAGQEYLRDVRTKLEEFADAHYLALKASGTFGSSGLSLMIARRRFAT